MAGEYKIVIEVEGGVSGQTSTKGGQPTTPTGIKKEAQQTDIEKIKRNEKFKQIRNMAGGAAATIGASALTVYEQNATFKGDSNTIARIGEAKKWGSRAVVTGTLLATGNVAGAGLYIGYTAFNMALENRKLLNDRRVNAYQSTYYQQRLVYDVSGRSR